MYILLKNDRVVFADNHPVESVPEDLELLEIEDTTMEVVFENIARPLLVQRYIAEQRELRGLQSLHKKALHVNNSLCKIIAEIISLFNTVLDNIEATEETKALQTLLEQWKMTKFELLLMSTTAEELVALSATFITEAKHMRDKIYTTIVLPNVNESSPQE